MGAAEKEEPKGTKRPRSFLVKELGFDASQQKAPQAKKK